MADRPTPAIRRRYGHMTSLLEKLRCAEAEHTLGPWFLAMGTTDVYIRHCDCHYIIEERHGGGDSTPETEADSPGTPAIGS